MKETDKNRYIWYNGLRFYVTQKDYSETMRPEWKEATRRKVRIKRELSLDWLKERGGDIQADGPLVHEIIEDKLLLDSLLAALNRLEKDERNLIMASFFGRKTEREIASETNRSQSKVHREKERIFGKLRDWLS